MNGNLQHGEMQALQRVGILGRRRLGYGAGAVRAPRRTGRHALGPRIRNGFRDQLPSCQPRLPSRRRPRSRHQGDREGKRRCRRGSDPSRRPLPVPARGRQGDCAAFRSGKAGRDLRERLRGDLGHVHERGRERGLAGSGGCGFVGAEFCGRGSGGVICRRRLRWRVKARRLERG